MPIKTPNFLKPRLSEFRRAAIKDNRNRIMRISVGANAPAPFFAVVTNEVFVGVHPDRVQTIFFENNVSEAVNKLLNKAKSKAVIKTQQSSRVDNFIQVMKKLRTNNVRLLKFKTSNGLSYYVTRDPMTFVLATHYVKDKEPDWEKIDSFLKKQNFAYHSGSTQSKLTDQEFDNWKETYLIYGKKWPFDNTVGAAPRSKEKITLPQQMGSLEKENTSKGIFVWAKKNKITAKIATPKLDGISALVVYKKGLLTNVYTRGDGIKGRDITRHAYLVKDIPKSINIKEPLHVRGELLIKNSTFIQKFEGAYANPRNMMAGVVNRSNSSLSELEETSFFVFDSDYQAKSKSEMLNSLKKTGFKTVPYITVDDSISLDNILSEFKKRLDFDMDGLVVEANNPKERKKIGYETNSLNPKFARAYKPPKLDNITQATIKSVEWNVSRHRQLKPVAIIKPVKLAGVTVSRATLFNAAFVIQNRIGPGAIVELTRSGEVIPHVMRVIKGVSIGVAIASPDKKKFGDYHLNETSVDYVLGEKVFSEDVEIKNTLHFLEKCGVERIKEETVRAFYNTGFNSIEKIVKMNFDDLMKVERMGEKSANNIIEEFKKLQAVPMDRLMYASNMFGRNFGTRRFKSILERFGRNTLRWNGQTIREIAEQIATISGFSYEGGKQFAKGIKPFLRFKKSLEPYVNGVYPTKTKNKSNKLSGASVVFTGIRDTLLEDIIVNNGGSIGGSVSKNTSHVIWTGNKTLKSDKAKSMGIPLLTIEQFKKKYSL